jgi:hypothetical protein
MLKDKILTKKIVISFTNVFSKKIFFEKFNISENNIISVEVARLLWYITNIIYQDIMFLSICQ